MFVLVCLVGYTSWINLDNCPSHSMRTFCCLWPEPNCLDSINSCEWSSHPETFLFCLATKSSSSGITMTPPGMSFFGMQKRQIKVLQFCFMSNLGITSVLHRFFFPVIMIPITTSLTSWSRVAIPQRFQSHHQEPESKKPSKAASSTLGIAIWNTGADGNMHGFKNQALRIFWTYKSLRVLLSSFGAT